MTDSDTAVVWFRSDLRVHDNETLLAAARAADELIPLYAVDPAQFDTAAYGGEHSFSYQKTGAHRAQFLRESVQDLRRQLQECGSDLLLRTGDPATVLDEVTTQEDVETVYTQRLPGTEERSAAQEVDTRLDAHDVGFEQYWTHTLYHIDDLHCPPSEIADTFTPFKDAVEAHDDPREPVPVPDLPPLPDSIDVFGAVPTLDDLGIETPPVDDRAVLPFEGGERRGLDRLDTYLWDRDCLREYRETRNELLGADYSSKFSPWLAAGCLSPRRVAAEIREYEAERVANDSTYWLLFELRWRDFFQFQFVKHEGTHFTRPGIRNRTELDWSSDEQRLDRWRRGETGIPFIDANMRELAQTGYMSNRGRQNVASFLAADLGIDWRRGAAYFETQLVDYDPCSNYGNWAYVAGVGNDSRDHAFDVLSQAHRYDEDAAYVKTWCPELDDLPPTDAHEPWRLTPEEQARYGLQLGADYPRPMVPPETIGH
jgi:deoxyribodipyrimidine photo-lyase